MSDLPELPTPVTFQYRHIYFLSKTPVWMTSDFYNGHYSKVSRGLYTEDQLRSYAITALAPLEAALGNLLAVIHRDGGHYQAEHGTEKAVADAMEAISHERTERDALAEDAERYRWLHEHTFRTPLEVTNWMRGWDMSKVDIDAAIDQAREGK